MEDFVSFFLVLITITIFYIYLETKALNVTYVVSTVDNHKYLVRNEPDKLQAANLLATMKERLSRLVDYTKEYKAKEKDETRKKCRKKQKIIIDQNARKSRKNSVPPNNCLFQP